MEQGKWKQFEHKDTGERFITCGNKNIAFTPRPRTKQAHVEAEANAERIVKAVNCHDELVEALKGIKEPTGTWSNDKVTYLQNVIDHTIELAQQALARAEAV